MNEIQKLIAEVAKARRKVLALVENLSAEQGAFKPSENEWSVAEILEHLVLAEQVGINLIWKAVAGVHAGKPVFEGDLPHKGLRIEAIVEKTWQEKETAPDVATPLWGGPVQFWTAALRTCQPLLEALGEALDGLNIEKVVYPHPLSGPLDARQRLEFLRFHLDRHRKQIERVLKFSNSEK